MIKELSLRTSSRVELVDITDLVQEVVAKSGIKSGLCCVYVPHTTAGITINENADPSVRKDIIKELNKIIPFEDNYFSSRRECSGSYKSKPGRFFAEYFFRGEKISFGNLAGGLFLRVRWTEEQKSLCENHRRLIAGQYEVKEEIWRFIKKG